ncbi:unnamed protein product [Effrenium voratum]|uniref:Uncharacterized protein n=1 Tax=Effrenium voratum TaxID=2562239 RepID=A0AA36ICA1_9DINO|nr:unnamed protein product [Effrenium voratum]CAJ1446566.1 unnamed protein product [Effrenium voratum]
MGCLDDFAAPCALAAAMKRSVQEALQEPTSASTPIAWTEPHGHTWQRPENVLFVLDYDDTILPTTWLASKMWFRTWIFDKGPLDQMAGTAADLEKLQELDAVATEFLRTMGGLGTPVCITLAQRSWVEESMKAFLPQLAQLWEEMGVDVHYATEEYVTSITRQGHWCTKPSGHSQLEGTVLELQQRCIKKRKVMQRVLRRFNLKNGNVWLNAVSLGDGLAERNALQEISLHHQNPPDPVTGEIPIFRVKTIQMLEEPLIHELQSQLKVLRGWLRPLVNWAQDLDTVLGD